MFHSNIEAFELLNVMPAKGAKGGENMAESEMLNLILESVNSLKSDMKTVSNRLDNMDNRLDNMENRLDRLESEMSALKSGQADIRKDIKKVDKRVSDTYELALDAWGKSTENRKWLESAN